MHRRWDIGPRFNWVGRIQGYRWPRHEVYNLRRNRLGIRGNEEYESYSVPIIMQLEQSPTWYYETASIKQEHNSRQTLCHRRNVRETDREIPNCSLKMIVIVVHVLTKESPAPLVGQESLLYQKVNYQMAVIVAAYSVHSSMFSVPALLYYLCALI